jgi:nucleoside-diphosphate-sugar epimerase
MIDMSGPSHRVLVTGGTGFIGRHLNVALKRKNFEVFPIARSDADLCDKAAVRSILERYTPNLVIHLAANGVRDPGSTDEQIITSNLAMTENLISLLPQGTAFLSIGSMAEYGFGGRLSEDMKCSPQTVYAKSKFLSGRAGQHLANLRGLSFCHARLFHIYGPGEPAHRLFPALLSSLVEGKDVLLSDGLQRRDFVHVYDAVDALTEIAGKLLERSASTPELINLGTGVAVSIGDVARWTASSLGASQKLLKFNARARSPADEDELIADTTVFEMFLSNRIAQRLHPAMDVRALMGVVDVH